MLSCFTSSEESTAITILPIRENQLEDWVKLQPERVKNYIHAIAFRAKPGSTAIVCNAEGLLEKVLVGLHNTTPDFSIFGQLAANLPKAVYKIDDAIKGKQLYQAVLAWGMGSYQFTPYKKIPQLEAKLWFPEQELDYPYLEALLRAIYLVRDLINTPADDMMPADLAEAMAQLAEEFKATINIISGDDLLKENYPVIHAVGRASEHPPCLIDMRWGDKKNPKVTLVGKGINFDSGGLNIKPSSGMSLMKKDMAGAAHVMGLAHIIMAMKLPVNLRVLIPAAENAVSGASYHPGDVLISRKGTSIEVTNTDAEGRLVLCDALHEAATEQPELLLDFATLTGAARVALGTDISALFTSDDALAVQLIECGQEENDLIWRLPLYAPYKKLLDSKVADMTNSGSSPYGGAIVAALFLKEFVPNDISWAHFDIMAWNLSGKPAQPEGGEAMALRAVARYLVRRFGEAKFPLPPLRGREGKM